MSWQPLVKEVLIVTVKAAISAAATATAKVLVDKAKNNKVLDVKAPVEEIVKLAEKEGIFIQN